MNWIILALTLGASITSIIHGVFMLFGSLSISGGAIPGIPSTLLASLPIAAAIFALIGGIIAFNQSKWGALFLFLATGICAASRDTWLYGGLYFFAALFCFFLRAKQQDPQDYMYDYDDDNEEYPPEPDEDFYYDQNENLPPPPVENIPVKNINLKFNTLDDDIQPVVNEPPKVRHRTSKSCPTCGEIVSRDTNYCPTCGTRLFAGDENLSFTPAPPPPVLNEDAAEVQNINEQLLTPANAKNDFQPETLSLNDEVPMAEANLNYNLEDGEEMSRAQTGRKVLVKTRRNDADYQPRASKRPVNRLNEAASSYQEFSQSPYTRRAKKRKRSAGRKFLNILLLVGAIGGALYFLLGLRKLPPGDLPPMVQPEVINANEMQAQNNNIPLPGNDDVAEPVSLVVAENILPDFTPERVPRTGIITGSSVNFRTDHTTNSGSIAKLSRNARVEILDTFNVTSGRNTGIWYNIRANGREGWVYGQYLRPVASGLPAGYSNALLRTFGSNRGEMIDTLGAPRSSTTSSAEWTGLTATFKGDDITRIRLTSSNRELQNGLKPGMSQTALQQIMGYPSSTRGKTFSYNEGSKTGLTVQLDSKNLISSITVNEI